VEVPLAGVGREVHVPSGAAAPGLARHDELRDKLAAPPEDLDPVVAAVADVDETVPRDPYAMHRRSERRDAPVAGRAPVGAPVALVGAGLRVEHDDPVVAIAVGDEQ